MYWGVGKEPFLKEKRGHLRLGKTGNFRGDTRGKVEIWVVRGEGEKKRRRRSLLEKAGRTGFSRGNGAVKGGGRIFSSSVEKKRNKDQHEDEIVEKGKERGKWKVIFLKGGEGSPFLELS